MAVSYQTPGVYIQEIPAVRSIQGVSTDIAVFIGIPAKLNAPTTPQLITSWSQYQAIYGGFVWNCYLAYAVYSFFASGGSVCYVINAISKADPTYQPAIIGDKDTGLTVNVASPWLACDYSNGQISSSDISIIVRGQNSSASVFSLSVIALKNNKSTSLSNQLLQQYRKINNLPSLPYQEDYYILEEFLGFTAKDLVIDGKTGVAPIEKTINGNSLFINVKVDATANINDIKLDILNLPIMLGNSTAPGLTPLSESTISALLDTIQGFSIIAIPDNVNESESTQNANINALLNYLELKGNAIAVIDPPYFPLPDDKDENTTHILEFVHGSVEGCNALNSSYGAIYYPWTWIQNPSNGLQVLVPPSGLVTGRYAYTDNTVGVFAAPAGTQEGLLQLATGVAEAVTSADQSLLNPAGINVIRQLLKYGICIWGARTLSQSGGITYVNIRRLLIFIEQSIYESIQWVVFEANTPTLWGTLIRDISAFLMTLWQQGALAGSSASQAFYVICDSSNNTPETMSQGILYIDVGVAPVTPAEFVVLRITQIVQGS